MGNVGMALYNTILDLDGYTIDKIYYHRKEPDLNNKVSCIKGVPDGEPLEGQLIFLTVPDDAISFVSEQLSQHYEHLEGYYFVHCSGTHSSDSLKALKEKGAQVASFHPMKAITPDSKTFEGSWFDIEGDEDLLKVLESLTESLQAHSFRVTAEAKPFLHASAVVASNYLVVLADLLTKIAAKGKIPEEVALKALGPLMESTLANIKHHGVTESLTGPIARGDVQTVKKHVQSLADDQDLLHMYKMLGLEAVKIAIRKNGDSKALQNISELLQ